MSIETLYVVGDVTYAFKAKAGHRSRMVMDRCPIHIICEELPCKVDKTLNRFVEISKTAKYFKVMLDDKPVIDRLEMPRDVYHVILGIGFGIASCNEDDAYYDGINEMHSHPNDE